jgi:predicted TIM-barrel fold metal-dependent hydrolase
MLHQRPEQLRGIAVVAPQVDADELDALQSAGVVGIRLNLDSLPIPDFRAGPWPHLLGELRQREWQIELHREAADLPRLLDPLLEAGVRIVVDHFGRPSPELGVDDPGFRHLLRAAATNQVWVKLSAAYRNGPQGSAHAPALAAQLLEHFGPERLVWGSDWPHTRHEARAAMPDLLARMTTWVPDAASRRAIFGETALELFGFESELRE